MAKKGKKRKSTAQHDPIPAPARSAPMNGRRQVSYEDLETNPTPPVPRHMVSYASSDDEDEEEAAVLNGNNEEKTAAEVRHRIMSRESDGSYDTMRAQPRIDVTYGQFGAFPGLESCQYAPFYGPASDGLDYLRMVRSEAREFPHVMTKKDRKTVQQDYEEIVEDDADGDLPEAPHDSDGGDGYYSDGAYVAKPLRSSTAERQEHQHNPQEVYYDRLKHLFTAHRQRCHASPSADAVAALDQQHPISFPQSSSLAQAEWKNLLIQTTPLLAQLCSMDRWTVWRLLRLCERHIRSYALRVENIPPSLAQWIWGLLGRLEDCHQMANEEVSKVRELGKCATFCAARYRVSKSKREEEAALGAGDEGEALDYDEDVGKTVETLDSKSADPVKAYTHSNGIVAESSSADRVTIDEDTTTVQHGDAFAVVKETSETISQLDGSTETAPDMEMAGTAPDQNQGVSDLFTAKRQQLQQEDEKQQEESAKQLQQEVDKSARTLEETPSAQTSALLDFIITVAGEFYGQRDLLWSRQKWEKEGV